MYGQSLKYLFKIIVFFHLIYYGADYHFNHIYAPFIRSYQIFLPVQSFLQKVNIYCRN